MDPVRIDVIIPVYKPGENFAGLIMRLKKQSLPVSRIIIMNTVDAGGGQDVHSLAAGDPLISVYDLPKSEFDHGGTRDRAARLSDADYLLFMTQDAMPKDTRLVERLYEAFSNGCVKAAYARQLPRKNCREIERYTRDFNYPAQSRVKTAADLETLGIKTYFCSNVCAMYERRTYLKLGGFIKKTIFNEDMIFAGGLIKAGYAIAYAADARVIHSHNYTGLQQFHRNFDLAVSQADHPEVFAGVRSEGEGAKLVAQTARHCLDIRKPWLIVSLVYYSACKYAGYLLGKHYTVIPRRVRLMFTMNKGYWE